MVKIINHDKNRGLAAARNTGVDASTGDYLMHVDSDDYLENNAVEILVKKAVEENDDIIVFGNYVIKNGGRDLSLPKYSLQGTDKVNYIKAMLVHQTPSSIWNKFYNAKFYKNSGIRSIEGLNHGEDYAVVPRLIHKASKIGVVELPLYYYEQSNVNSYMNNITQKSVLNIKQADEILIDYFAHIEDSSNYQDALSTLEYRSMLALVKVAKCENYSLIYNMFELSGRSVSGLSSSDRLLVFLLERRLFSLAALVIGVFWKLRK